MTDAKTRREAAEAKLRRLEAERRSKREVMMSQFLAPGEALRGTADCNISKHVKKTPRKFVRRRFSGWERLFYIALSPFILAGFVSDLVQLDFVIDFFDRTTERGARRRSWSGGWKGMAGQLIIAVSAANKDRESRSFRLAFTDHRILVFGTGAVNWGRSGPPALVAQYSIGSLRVSGGDSASTELRFADNSHAVIDAYHDTALIRQHLGGHPT